MLLIIVATGNHFVVDAALGGLVVVAGWLAARRLVQPAQSRTATRARRLPGLSPVYHQAHAGVAQLVRAPLL